MKRMLAMLGALVAALALTFAWAPAAQADGYTPDIPTSCNISVPVKVLGKRVVFEATVNVNSGRAVTGRVEISVARGGAAARAARAAGAREVWSTTARYDGRTLRIEGPRLGRGQYIASMRFTPDSELYGGCADSVGFQMGAGGPGGPGGGPDAGGLPNTGGPHMMILLLGLGLVAVGGGLVTRGRALA